MIGWLVFAVFVVGAIVGAVLWIRSEKRWQPPPPTTPEAKEADRKLWSTRNMGQR